MTAADFVEHTPIEHSRAAVLEKADTTGLDKLSEVTVFAIPLFHQGDLVQLVYLPVPVQQVSGETSKSKVPHKVRDYAQKAQTKFDTMWQQWGQKDKGVRRRVYDMGQRQVENVSPESRLLTGIKRGTKQLIVYHPSTIPDEVVNQQLASIAASQGKSEYWKLSAACAALPVAFTVDTLVLIGLPPMLTGYTGYLSYKHYKGASGAATLKKLGQAPTSPQPLTAGLANLQQNQQQHQQQPLDGNTSQAYTGFAPQATGTSTQPQQYSPAPGAEGSYRPQPQLDPSPQGYPGLGPPSDQHPQTYQTMLDSLPSAPAVNASEGGGPVHYPNVQGWGSAPPQATGGTPPAGAGYLSQATGTVAGANASTSAAAITPQASTPAPVVGMEFIAVPALDDFVIRVANRSDGALSEEDILELCSVIGAPELVKPLLELKQRQLRMVNKAKK